jgi:hypothetical protein
MTSDDKEIVNSQSSKVQDSMSLQRMLVSTSIVLEGLREVKEQRRMSIKD